MSLETVFPVMMENNTYVERVIINYLKVKSPAKQCATILMYLIFQINFPILED